jgi:hypothetical protein
LRWHRLLLEKRREKGEASMPGNIADLIEELGV